MGGLGVKVQHFPLTLLVVLTTLTLPCERDTLKPAAHVTCRLLNLEPVLSGAAIDVSLGNSHMVHAARNVQIPVTTAST